MSVLDPATASETPHTGEFFIKQFPFLQPRHFEHGYLPNRARMMVGDLILTSPLKHSISSCLIRRAQARIYPHSAEWTHAAVYVGDWTIIQANPFKGIHKAVLFDYVPTHRMKVRRLKIMSTMQKADREAAGLRIALEASLRMPESSYAFAGAMQIARDALATSTPVARFNISQDIIRHRHHICSSLYDACVMRATGQQLRSPEHMEASLNVSPAMLSDCDAMIDVDVGWAKLVESTAP